MTRKEKKREWHKKSRATPEGKRRRDIAKEAYRLTFKSFITTTLAAARGRCKTNGKVFNMSKWDLMGLWDYQKGRCALTGTVLVPRSEDQKERPSIDRIDNDKGYFPGNIQWTTHYANARKGVT